MLRNLRVVSSKSRITVGVSVHWRERSALSSPFALKELEEGKDTRLEATCSAYACSSASSSPLSEVKSGKETRLSMVTEPGFRYSFGAPVGSVAMRSARPVTVLLMGESRLDSAVPADVSASLFGFEIVEGWFRSRFDRHTDAFRRLRFHK